MASCLAETMVLALDDRAEALSLGRNLQLAAIESIGRRAREHGFRFDRAFAFGQPLSDSALTTFRKRSWQRRIHAPRRAAGPDIATPAISGATAAERYRRHVNPVMIALGGELVKTFVRGEGCWLWDADGRRYLDMLAGYGSVNLGHNHPGVVDALRQALTEQAPGFVPAATHPRVGALAERLVAMAPAGLELAFFANSGAEAVEAALKLARRATGRHGFLYCERSYHGKTYGALSVTGNATYQAPFDPLVPACTAVPFGDAAALEQALAAHRPAAFIVEPLQAEGGMRVPPPGYLAAAQRLCRAAGTLLIVDEVQTGFGRTGPLFACETESVEPDCLVLAKSLGGGAVPIGAMLARRDHWLRAYGTLSTFALHSSTFGGGSLACAAGLAATEALADPELLRVAGERARQLRSGLEEIARSSPLIAEVRGAGLLIGVELHPPPHCLSELTRGLLAGPGGAFLVEGLDRVVDGLLATHVLTLLIREHAVFTQVTRSSPRVLRIEPPLTISQAQVAQFLDAFAQTCAEVEAACATFDEMAAKSTLGRHGSDEGVEPPRIHPSVAAALGALAAESAGVAAVPQIQ
jgi:putrescine aminotransferase